MLSQLHLYIIRLSGKSSWEEHCRDLSVGTRQQPGVKQNSFCNQCIEPFVCTTSATITALRLFSSKKICAVKPGQSRVVPHSFTSLHQLFSSCLQRQKTNWRKTKDIRMHFPFGQAHAIIKEKVYGLSHPQSQQSRTGNPLDRCPFTDI